MNANFINPFLSSITNVLKTMAMVGDIETGKASLKTTETASGAVSGVINMDGQPVSGSLAISFSKEFICEVYQRMLGEEVDEINETVQDLVGELTNMVSGSAKTILSELGYDFGLATPHILHGANHAIKHSIKGPKIIIPFKTVFGEFFVETSFQTSVAIH